MKTPNVRKLIPKAVSRGVGKKALALSTASPNLLFGAGVVGVVGATVLACRSTLHLDEVLDEGRKTRADAKRVNSESPHRYTDQQMKRDITRLYVRDAVHVCRLYAPATALGVASIAALTGSHVILTNRNAGLTAAYAALDKGFKEYRARVREEFGEDKDLELRHGVEYKEIAKDTENGTEVQTVKRAKGTSIYSKFFDEYTPNWNPRPEMNRLFLQAQQNFANDKLHATGHLFLNEVYDMLGFERTTAGSVVGWSLSGEGNGYVDFGIFNDRDNPAVRDFVNGHNNSILLDFNVDGPINTKLKEF